MRCLEDPIFDPEINSPSSTRNPTAAVPATKTAGPTAVATTGVTADAPATGSSAATTDVLEKARNRFDRFWGGNNTEDENV